MLRLIDWILFWAVSAIFQPFNSSVEIGKHLMWINSLRGMNYTNLYKFCFRNRKAPNLVYSGIIIVHGRSKFCGTQRTFNKIINCLALLCNKPVTLIITSPHEPATFWQSTNIEHWTMIPQHLLKKNPTDIYWKWILHYLQDIAQSYFRWSIVFIYSSKGLWNHQLAFKV